RAAVAQWEDSAYRDYESIVARLARASGRVPLADTTGADGRVTLRLPEGRWWIHARSWDAQDPNAEWYWNVPVTGDTVELSPATGELRARY
ncbi:MAG TPA: hypothetical protein VNK43_13530, partial [Gemmatimonadales bacterium]|nr:hypothetical protein [Gemmatimonadales bacterium]